MFEKVIVFNDFYEMGRNIKSSYSQNNCMSPVEFD